MVTNTLREALLKRSPGTPSSTHSFFSEPAGPGIGNFASFVLCYNTLLGPGLLGLPTTFQKAGWLASSLTLIVVCLISSLAATLLCDVMERIPPNQQESRPTSRLSDEEPSPLPPPHQQRREFSDLFGYVFGPRAFTVTQWAFCLCCFSQAVSGIVATAQVVDELLLFNFGATFGVQLLPLPALLSWRESDCAALGLGRFPREEGLVCEPFSAGGAPISADTPPLAIITLGYAICAAALAPLGYLSLKDNAQVQIASFWLQLLLILKFGYDFYDRGLNNFPLKPVGADYTQVLPARHRALGGLARPRRACCQN